MTQGGYEATICVCKLVVDGLHDCPEKLCLCFENLLSAKKRASEQTGGNYTGACAVCQAVLQNIHGNLLYLEVHSFAYAL